MNEFKKSLKENRVLLILLGVVVLVFTVFSLFRFILGNIVYQSGDKNGSIETYNMHHYEDNEYKVMRIEELDMVERYYQMYLNALLMDQEKAWSMLSEETKTSFHDKIEEYKKEMKKRITVKSKENKVRVYQKTANGYLVIDTENYQYEIVEKGVMNIKITLKGQVR